MSDARSPEPEQEVAAPAKGASRRTLVLLFVASFLVRLPFLLFAGAHDVQPLYDEANYVGRAEAMGVVLDNLLAGRESSAFEWRSTYRGGVWPPLHPLLLLLGLRTGLGVVGARLVVLLLSALTTPLVFLVARRFTSRRGALCAAALHVVYPSFVAFGHLLWSETLFLFFLFATLWAFGRLVASDDAAPDPTGWKRALLAGLLLGAMD